MNTCSHSLDNQLASERLAAWLQASAQGDRAAFRALHDATRTRLLALAMEVLPHASRAEEVLQDAYVKVWRAAHQFDARIARPMTWLMRIVRNTAIDHHRARQAETRHTVTLDAELTEQVQAQLVDPGPTPEEHCQARQQQRHTQAQLARLPAQHRQAVAMVLCQGHSAQEAAQRQGLRLPQLRGRLRAGSEQLAAWVTVC
jgi:RNA polymerase sigma-70 factor, ECF subfamily